MNYCLSKGIAGKSDIPGIKNVLFYARYMSDFMTELASEKILQLYHGENKLNL